MKTQDTDDLDKWLDNLETELNAVVDDTAYEVQDLLIELSPMSSGVKKGKWAGRQPEYSKGKYRLHHDLQWNEKGNINIENTVNKKTASWPEGFEYGKYRVEEAGWEHEKYVQDPDDPEGGYTVPEITPAYHVYEQAVNILKNDYKVKDD